MTKQDILAQMLVCADARILLEFEGHRPMPEIENGRDTGRVAHDRIGGVFFLQFEDGPVLVTLS